MAKRVSKKLILEDVRCSYVYLDHQRKNDDGSDGGYGIQILIENGSKQHKKVEKIVKKIMEEAFPGVKPARLKHPLRSGDDEMDGEEYQGMMFMNANSKTKKPGIVNRKGETADPDDLEEYCFSGAYFHVSISLYNFEVDGNKGVACGLQNVMLRKKGERLDGTVSAKSEFSEYANDDLDDDDLDDEFDD